MKLTVELELVTRKFGQQDYFGIVIHSKEVYCEAWGKTLQEAFEELNHYHGQKLFNACKEKQCSV